ncbi:MAG: tetratricopeptide repeat protein [Armatimonadota bacterium]|nr:MAG: tetratricopeptide repeat protein [Armatimonadota bacterium]
MAEARAAAARGDREAAITHLEQAVAEDDGLALAHRWLSRLYAEKGLHEKALDSVAAAWLLDPDPRDGEHMQRLLEERFPRSMARRTAKAIPFTKARIALELVERGCGAAAHLREALYFPGDDRDAPATDPQFGWRFDRACYGYVLDPEVGRWSLTFVVHYSSAAGATRRETAGHCTALLLRAACAREEHLGPVGPPGRPLDVWLAELGRAGAETSGGSIYLLDAARERHPGEWVRQVIHECGHAALPGVNHFDEPEPWANGRLGEHLFSRWLTDRRASAPEHPWLSAADFAPLIADAERCMHLFLQTGPGSSLLDDASARGMDYYLGYASYLERAFGGRLLASAMRLTAGNASRDFAAGVEEALRRASSTGIELRAVQRPTEGDVAHWVYLPAGAWRAVCKGCGAATAFNGHLLGGEDGDVGRLDGGWHSVVLPPGAVVTFRPAAAEQR